MKEYWYFKVTYRFPVCGLGSSVGIATGYGLDGQGIESQWGEIFHPSRPALGPIQPPTLFLILGWGYKPERVQAGIYLLFYTLLASLLLLVGIILFFGVFMYIFVVWE